MNDIQLHSIQSLDDLLHHMTQVTSDERSTDYLTTSYVIIYAFST